MGEMKWPERRWNPGSLRHKVRIRQLYHNTSFINLIRTLVTKIGHDIYVFCWFSVGGFPAAPEETYDDCESVTSGFFLLLCWKEVLISIHNSYKHIYHVMCSFACVRVCMYAYIIVCLCMFLIFVFVCLCVCVYVCMCVCVCVFVCVFRKLRGEDEKH